MPACTGEFWNEWTLRGKLTQKLWILHLFFFLNVYCKLLKYLKYYHDVSWALTFIYDTIYYRHWIFTVEMLQPQDSFQICGGLGMTLSPRYDALTKFLQVSSWYRKPISAWAEMSHCQRWLQWWRKREILRKEKWFNWRVNIKRSNNC